MTKTTKTATTAATFTVRAWGFDAAKPATVVATFTTRDAAQVEADRLNRLYFTVAFHDVA